MHLKLEIAGLSLSLVGSDDVPPPRPRVDAEVDGEEVSGVHPTRVLLKPLRKAGPRIAQVVPLFRRMVG